MKAEVSSRWHKPRKFVLVGCGRMGHSYATVIGSHPETELAAVIDPNADAARAFGSSFGSSVYNSLEDYAASGRTDECAVICTPPSNHADIACRMMEKGLHVLCEQPFALDSASAEKVIDVAHTSGVQIQMASRLRFVADVIQTKGLIQAGILGQVLVFEGDFRDVVNMRNRWNLDKKVSGGGVLIDRGSAAVEVAAYLFGHLLEVCAEEGARIQSPAVEDTVRLQLRTISGILGTVHLSWNLEAAGDDYFRIYGTQGTLCIGWKRSMYRPNGAKDWITFGEGYNTLKALKRQISHFIDAVAGQEIPEMSAGDVIESVRTVEAAYQSLRTGRFVKIHPATAEKGSQLGARKFSVLHTRKAPPSG